MTKNAHDGKSWSNSNRDDGDEGLPLTVTHSEGDESGPRRRTASWMSCTIVLLTVSVLVLISSTVFLTQHISEDEGANVYEWQMKSLPYKRIKGRLLTNEKDPADKRYTSFLEWELPGIRDASGALLEDFGVEGESHALVPNTSDPLAHFQEKLNVPLWRYDTKTCAYLNRQGETFASVEKDIERIRTRFRKTFMDFAASAGNTRVKLASRGAIQNANLELPALDYNGTHVTAAFEEMDALFGQTWREFWTEISPEAMILWYLHHEQRCDIVLPHFDEARFNEMIAADGDVDDKVLQFWRGTYDLNGHGDYMTRDILDELEATIHDEDDEGFSPTHEYNGAINQDEHVFGTWIAMRSRESQGEEDRRGLRKKLHSNVGHDIIGLVPKFASSDVKLALPSVTNEEARAVCAVAAACEPYYRKADFKTTCKDEITAPLFGRVWALDVLHSFIWTVPMLTAEKTTSRHAFLASILHTARLCQASTTHPILMTNCGHGVGHAVLADTLVEITVESMTVQPSVDALWKRYLDDSRIITMGRTKDSKVSADRTVDFYTTLLDCAHFGKAMDQLGGDKVFSVNSCMSGVYHQMLVHDIGFSSMGFGLEGRPTRAILERMLENKWSQAIYDIVHRSLGDVDVTVLVVMFRHCHMFKDAYLELLMDEDMGRRFGADTGELRDTWREFRTIMKLGVTSCFYFVGFFSGTEMFLEPKSDDGDATSTENDGPVNFHVVLQNLYKNLMSTWNTKKEAPAKIRDASEHEKELMVVILEICDALGSSKCDDICSSPFVLKSSGNDEFKCMQRCRNISKAYISPLCWYGAGAISLADPRGSFNRCTEGCRQLGCSRREWEYCSLGFIEMVEIGLAQPGNSDPEGLLEAWKEGGEFMEKLVDLFETKRLHKDWAVPITGTRLLESARAFERYANTTMPRRLSET